MKRSLVIRPATAGDADLLAPCLRPQDRDEIYAVTGSSSPLPVLREGIACSDPCLAATDAGGLPIALFGVIPGEVSAGKVWLLGAPDLMQHRFSVGRLSRAWIESLHEQYAMLWNYVDQRNTAHVRWLRWCGFSLTPVAQYGFENRPFYYLEHRTPDDKGVVLQPSARFQLQPAQRPTMV